jgi:hypothetical protein
MEPAGNFFTGAAAPGVENNIFYCGHAVYCMNSDGSFNDGAIPFTVSADPPDVLTGDGKGVIFQGGQFSRVTLSITYFAWIVTAKPATCGIPDMTLGYDLFNVVSDGYRAYWMPRCQQDPPSAWKNWQPVKNNFPPSAFSEDPSVVAASTSISNTWLSPPATIVPCISCRLLTNIVGELWELAFDYIVSFNCLPQGACWLQYLYVFMSYYKNDDTNHGVLLKIDGASGTLLSSVDIPGNASTWTHASLIIQTGAVDIGGDGGLVQVPVILLTNTGGGGGPYTPSDFSGLNTAISADANVVANKAKEHPRLHTFTSHTDFASSVIGTNPSVNSVTVWDTGAGGWVFAPVSTVMEGTPVLNCGTC